jgi:hypothetical protein
MARTPQEVFAAHSAALASGDISRILEDYHDDAVVMTLDGAVEGRAAIQGFLAAALGALPHAEFTFESTVYWRDALLVTWHATSPKGRITDAVDTFVFSEGKIRLQTIVMTMELT